MTSWKTTLGGACAALGTFLWGAPVAIKQFSPDTVMDAGLVKWCLIIGLVMTGAGIFFTALFARDNGVTSEQVKASRTKKTNGTNKPPAGLAGLLLALVSVGVLWMATGCVLFPKARPGADPLVVQAEALAESSKDSLDAFLKWELRNRAIVGEDVTAAADLVREFAPTYIRELRAATKQYKEFRSQDNADQIDSAIKTLQQLLATVRNYYQPKIATS